MHANTNTNHFIQLALYFCINQLSFSHPPENKNAKRKVETKQTYFIFMAFYLIQHFVRYSTNVLFIILVFHPHRRRRRRSLVARPPVFNFCLTCTFFDFISEGKMHMDWSYSSNELDYTHTQTHIRPTCMHAHSRFVALSSDTLYVYCICGDEITIHTRIRSQSIPSNNKRIGLACSQICFVLFFFFSKRTLENVKLFKAFMCECVFVCLCVPWCTRASQ